MTNLEDWEIWEIIRGLSNYPGDFYTEFGLEIIEKLLKMRNDK